MRANQSDAWRSYELGDVAELLFSGVDKKLISTEDTVRLCNYTDVYYHRRILSEMKFSEGSATKREIAMLHLRADDVLITKDSETPNDIAVPALVTATMPDVVCGYHLAIIRPEKGLLDGAYLTELFQFEPMRRYFSKLANGATRFGLSTTTLKHAQLLLPSLCEQKAIAQLLWTWDRATEAIQRLVKCKRRLKNGLVLRLLAGRARFPEFSKTSLEPIRLREVLEKVAEPISPEPAQVYRQIGVRSHGKGIFHKAAVSGTSLGNKRVYRVVPGCLTLNIIFAWERALGVTTDREEGMIASHRFPMFRPDKKRLVVEYALLFLLSKRGSTALEIASPGGAGRNRTLNQKDLLRTIIPLPSLAEQRKIVTFVQAADLEIELLERQLAAFRDQKKGLMQKLLTGQIRISTKQVQQKNRKD
jgi:restriction endonuclease S subunit